MKEKEKNRKRKYRDVKREEHSEGKENRRGRHVKEL